MREFPHPLTEKSLRTLMKDERYLRSSHPEHESYRDWIKEGYEELYGTGLAQYDATGRMINDETL